eukprot:4797176-Alexandrium_andersonii.AAC.1
MEPADALVLWRPGAGYLAPTAVAPTRPRGCANALASAAPAPTAARMPNCTALAAAAPTRPR